MKRRFAIVVAFAASFLALMTARPSGATTADGFEVALPAGIPRDVWTYFIPKDNPVTAAKIELGRQLFFDRRLSADQTISCSSCHDPALAFTDGKKLAEGIRGRVGARNSPSLLNAMFSVSLFWDGRAESLEIQAKLPLINPDEMGTQTYAEIESRLQKDSEYVRQFREAFGTEVTVNGIARAIASYERSLVSGNSAYDRFAAGDRRALGESAIRGLGLFRTRARCSICHRIDANFPFFTDMGYRNTGVAMNDVRFEPMASQAMAKGRFSPTALKELAHQDGGHELGRFLITGNLLDIGAYRTPSLRNVELTAPYFHDGSAATLKDVLRFYSRGGNDNAARDWELQAVDLTDQEQDNLIEFLKSLTSDDARKATESRSK